MSLLLFFKGKTQRGLFEMDSRQTGSAYIFHDIFASNRVHDPMFAIVFASNSVQHYVLAVENEPYTTQNFFFVLCSIE